MAVVANLITEAADAADMAADRLGLRIADLTAVADQRAAAELFRRVWLADSADQLISMAMMRALAHAGNYLVGAYRGADLLGATVAFYGADDSGAHLHSHITGVTGAGQGVGYALKLHQRAWSLRRGLPEVRWTFDPLVRRNAYFNLHKLGARASGYLSDFYGEMVDGVNTGDATDRLYIRWELASPTVPAAPGGRPPGIPPGARVLLGRSAADEPVESADASLGGPLLVAVPADVAALRGRAPEAATRWRYAVREAMCRTLDAGYRITTATRDGWYLLEEATGGEAANGGRTP
jgi:predicted GNAT superfamily acetyltransferase